MNANNACQEKRKCSECHDPDYPADVQPASDAASSRKNKRARGLSTETNSRGRETIVTDDASRRAQRLSEIISREFSKEIAFKEQQLELIDQRLHKARYMLDRLRYDIVANYYKKQELPLSSTDSERVRDSQTLFDTEPVGPQPALHPSLKKIIGKRPHSYQEILRSCPPKRAAAQNAKHTIPVKSQAERRKERQLQQLIRERGIVIDHSKQDKVSGDILKSVMQAELASSIAMVDVEVNKEKQVGVSREELRVQPALSSTPLNASRLNNKTRHFFVIGNTSVFLGAESEFNGNGKLAYKWLVYVLSKDATLPLEHFVKKVRFFLHPSYRPNHIVDVCSPPFQITRRGWGEFPIRVQLFFHKRLQQKPVEMLHKIVLDKTLTGLHTVGAETLVEIWLRTELLPTGSDSQNQNTTTATIATATSTTTTTTTTTTTLPKQRRKSRTISFSQNKEVLDENFLEFLNKIQETPTSLCADIEKLEPTVMVSPSMASITHSPVNKLIENSTRSTRSNKIMNIQKRLDFMSDVPAEGALASPSGVAPCTIDSNAVDNEQPQALHSSKMATSPIDQTPIKLETPTLAEPPSAVATPTKVKTLTPAEIPKTVTTPITVELPRPKLSPLIIQDENPASQQLLEAIPVASAAQKVETFNLSATTITPPQTTTEAAPSKGVRVMPNYASINNKVILGKGVTIMSPNQFRNASTTAAGNRSPLGAGSVTFAGNQSPLGAGSVTFADNRNSLGAGQLTLTPTSTTANSTGCNYSIVNGTPKSILQKKLVQLIDPQGNVKLVQMLVSTSVAQAPTTVVNAAGSLPKTVNVLATANRRNSVTNATQSTKLLPATTTFPIRSQPFEVVSTDIHTSPTSTPIITTTNALNKIQQTAQNKVNNVTTTTANLKANNLPRNLVFQREGKIFLIDPLQMKLKQQQKKQVSLLKPQVSLLKQRQQPQQQQPQQQQPQQQQQQQLKEQQQQETMAVKMVSFDHNYTPTSCTPSVPEVATTTTIRTTVIAKSSPTLNKPTLPTVPSTATTTAPTQPVLPIAPPLHLGMRETRLKAAIAAELLQMRRLQMEQRFRQQQYSGMQPAVEYLLRSVTLIAKKDSVAAAFPFVYNTEKEFQDLPFLKQRACEWLRAKYVQRNLQKHDQLRQLHASGKEIYWSTREIVFFARHHAYTPILKGLLDINTSSSATAKSTHFLQLVKSELKNEHQVQYETLTAQRRVSSWVDSTWQKLQQHVVTFNDNQIIDVDSIADQQETKEGRRKMRATKTNMPLKFDSTQLYLPTPPQLEHESQLVNDICKELSMRLEPEQLVEGVLHPSVQTLLAQCLQTLAGKLLRSALAIKVQQQQQSSSAACLSINTQDIVKAIVNTTEFDFLTNRHCGMLKIDVEKQESRLQ